MMSHARFCAIHSGMTSAAKKVYEAVPITEHWDTSSVINEMHRIGGAKPDYRLINGCLNTLLLAGLVHEPIKGSFQREGVREAAPKKLKSVHEPEPQEEPMTPMTVVAIKQPSPVDRLGALAARVASMSVALKELSSDISDATVDVQLEMEAAGDDSRKLKQLQALLKSIG